MKYIFLITVLLLAGSLPVNADCPEGFAPDCNGYCVPESYLFDDICDDGLTQEYPIGSGYYVDFSCEEMFCDLFNCTGCEGGCETGFVLDCSGNCVPASYVRDGICDTGQRLYNGLPIVLSCEQFGCDLGDCPGACDSGDNGDNLNDVGACCIGGTCAELRREDCWITDGYFMGNHTLCQSNTCGCGEGWTQDCADNCIPMDRAGGGFCAHGEHWDFGDGQGTIVIDLDCEALACGLGSCLGVCPGGCCTGAECIEMNNWQECIDVGGIFLGSYVTCEEAGIEGCVDQQQPIQLPNTELGWSGALGSVILFPQWLASKEDILVAGAIHNEFEGEWKTAICIFRYVVDEWVEEALLIAPTGNSMDSHASYATDGNRIIVSSYINVTETTGRRAFDVFVYKNKTDTWDFEQTIDDGPTTSSIDYGQRWGDAVAIDGDALVIGNPALVIDGTDLGGGAELYRFDDEAGAWALTETLSRFGSGSGQDKDFYLGMSVALEGDIVALSSVESLWVYDISGSVAVGQQQFVGMVGNSHPWHRAIDIDNGRILGNMVHGGTFGSTLGGPIFEYIDSTWTKVATLYPFDVTASDGAGYISDLDGDMAIVTSVHDNDLGYQTGSAYVWKYDGVEWVFEAKLWSDRAVSDNQFGTSAALHGGSAYLSGRIDQDEGDNIKVFWPRGIAWSNPIGGLISDATNWDPVKPTVGDIVSFSLRSQTSITVNEELPFEELFVGLGSYAFDLLGDNRTLGAGQKAITLQGVPGIIAELKIKGGILQVEGDVYNGEEGLPGKIALVSNDAGVMGGMHVDGLYMQHEAGELLIELNTGRTEPPAQVTGTAPLLNGVLELVLADGYVPQVEDSIPLLSSEFIDHETAQFSIVLINDPLPEGLYIKLEYIDSMATGGTIYAKVDALANLFGYGAPSSEGIAGEATDVVLADIGSVSGTVDGFDDIVVTTADALHIFLSDGTGGIAGHTTYNSPSWNPKLFTSLAAVDAGDLDGDGTMDLAVVNSDTDEFIPIFNESYDINALTIGTPESTGPNPTDVLLININAVEDNDDDVIVACYGHTLTDGQIDFFESIPNPLRAAGFTKTGEVLAEGNPINIDPGDVNTDKDIAIYVVLGSGNAVGKMHDDPVGLGFGWAFESFTPVATGPLDIAVGDLTGDNIDDAVVSSPDSDVIGILRGLPGGGFAPSLQLLVGDEPTSVALVDFDNDGDKDIAVIAMGLDSGQREIMMYRNDTSLNGGNLMFASDAVYDSGLSPILVATGDLDGDDHDDLISINEIATYRGISNNMNIRKAVNCSSDFDGSGEVNVADLLEIIALWEAVGDRPQDLDGNGIVNVADLLILIAAWGPC